MSKATPSPHIVGDMYGTQVLIWYEKRKGANQTFSSVFHKGFEDEAKRDLERQICRHLLLPVQSFLKQQEHLISVMVLGNGLRAKPTGECKKMLDGILAYPFLTRGWLAWRLDYFLISYTKAAPGKSSTYYNYYIEMGKNMRAFQHMFSHLNGQSETASDFSKAIRTI